MSEAVYFLSYSSYIAPFMPIGPYMYYVHHAVFYDRRISCVLND